MMTRPPVPDEARMIPADRDPGPLCGGGYCTTTCWTT
jgi:hypothetical protein